MADTDNSGVPDDFWCSELARRAQEPASGTAVRAETWLALEVPGGWSAKAFEDSDLQEPVKAHLQRGLEAFPMARMQFIKQAESKHRQSTTLYIARSELEEPLLYQFNVNSMEDLLDFPLDLAWLEDQIPVNQAIYLVCTHSARDRCCARFGMETFNALSQYKPGRVWQSSHLGGHRFAANVACLPDGVLYGYVSPERAEELIDGHEAGFVDPDLLRGRSSFSKQAQAAEALLRRKMGNALGERLTVHFESSKPEIGVDYRVVFERADHTLVTVDLGAIDPPYENYVSCGAEIAKAVPHYRLLAIMT